MRYCIDGVIINIQHLTSKI